MIRPRSQAYPHCLATSGRYCSLMADDVLQQKEERRKRPRQSTSKVPRLALVTRCQRNLLLESIQRSCDMPPCAGTCIQHAATSDQCGGCAWTSSTSVSVPDDAIGCYGRHALGSFARWRLCWGNMQLSLHGGLPSMRFANPDAGFGSLASRLRDASTAICRATADRCDSSTGRLQCLVRAARARPGLVDKGVSHHSCHGHTALEGANR